jgi:uncharacterized protein (DUF305 family)
MIRTSTLPAAVLHRGLVAGAAVTTALILSACGGGTSPSGSGTSHDGMTASSSAPASAATFNDADVSFAQSMIPHHQQAVQMAAMADGRASNAPVKDLAAKIRAAQKPEIDTMNEWLTAWGKPMPMPGMSPSAAMSGMDHGSMPGMMSDADMAKLAAAKPAAFDKQFLTMMISHHEGAIEMAQQETTQGSNPDAKTLAQKIITDQQAEITTMKGLLTQL